MLENQSHCIKGLVWAAKEPWLYILDNEHSVLRWARHGQKHILERETWQQ